MASATKWGAGTLSDSLSEQSSMQTPLGIHRSCCWQFGRSYAASPVLLHAARATRSAIPYRKHSVSTTRGTMTHTGLKSQHHKPTMQQLLMTTEKSAPLNGRTSPKQGTSTRCKWNRFHLRMTSMTRWRRKVRLLWRAPKRFRSNSQTFSEGYPCTIHSARYLFRRGERYWASDVTLSTTLGLKNHPNPRSFHITDKWGNPGPQKKYTWIHLLLSQDHYEDFSSNKIL